jgi:hypothetical protein
MPKDTECAFTYGDLAKASGVTRNTIAQHRIRKHFDPESIESVAIYLARYRRQKLREQIVMAAIRRDVPNNPGGWKKQRRKCKKKPG